MTLVILVPTINEEFNTKIVTFWNNFQQNPWFERFTMHVTLFRYHSIFSGFDVPLNVSPGANSRLNQLCNFV